MITKPLPPHPPLNKYDDETDDENESDSLHEGTSGGASNAFRSKKGSDVWKKKCFGARKFAPQNVMKQLPGPTAYVRVFYKAMLRKKIQSIINAPLPYCDKW